MSFFDSLSKSYTNLMVRMGHYMVVVTSSNILTYQYVGDPIYHASGGLATLVAFSFDFASTLPLIRMSNKEEFKNSDLKERYEEGNPFLGKHPTLKEFFIKSSIIAVFHTAFSSLFPSLGYAHLSSIPMICRNNRNVAKSLEKELENYKSSFINPASF